jgi:hypothetical protein
VQDNIEEEGENEQGENEQDENGQGENEQLSEDYKLCQLANLTGKPILEVY